MACVYPKLCVQYPNAVHRRDKAWGLSATFILVFGFHTIA